MTKCQWYWDEYQHAGVDYADLEEVARYDERMGRFRDIAAENRAVIEQLQLGANDLLLEIGSGTGSLAIEAARHCRSVVGFDVSEVMREYARGKAMAEGLTNVAFQRGGFLTFELPERLFDAAVSQIALHHLPDFWKGVALSRVAKALKPGGRFVLNDVVFTFPIDDHREAGDKWVAGFPGDTRRNANNHLSREYSTFDWIMDGLLTRAGFSIHSKDASNPRHIVRYVCIRDAS